MDAAERAKTALFVEAVKRLPFGGRLTFRARGSSMRPFIEDGNLVELTKMDPVQAYPGDIVVFALSSQIVCHRLLKRRYRLGNMYFLSQGDTLFEKDPVFTSKSLLGIVTQVIKPDLGGYSLSSPFARLVNHLFVAVTFFKDIIRFTLLSVGFSPDVFYTMGFFRQCIKAAFLLWSVPCLFMLRLFSRTSQKGVRSVSCGPISPC